MKTYRVYTKVLFWNDVEADSLEEAENIAKEKALDWEHSNTIETYGRELGLEPIATTVRITADMTLKNVVKAAVESKDLKAIKGLVSRLRVRGFGGVKFDYYDTAKLFERCAGVPFNEFESLMQEIE